MLRLGRMTRPYWRKAEHGFTMVQMIIVIAIIAVVSTFGVLGITQARAQLRLQNSARRFAVFVEKARADSVRRHAAPGDESRVQTFDPDSTAANTFTVRMDFDGSGLIRTRTFTLDYGVAFATNPQTIAFDWRGRIPNRAVFIVADGTNPPIPIDVSGSGDITLGNQIFADDAIPDIALADVSPDVIPDPTPFPVPDPGAGGGGVPNPDATPTPTPNGNGNGNGNGNPHSTPTPTPVPSPTATPTPTPNPDPNASPTPVVLPCTALATPTVLVLSQSGVSSGSVTFALRNATGLHTLTARQSGLGNNLNVSVSPTSVTGEATAIVTISAKNGVGNRGNFTVTISANPSCGSTQIVVVSVIN